MTADGPDINTEEFKRQEIIKKYFQTRLKMTSTIRNMNPPRVITTAEMYHELTKFFKDPRDKKPETGMKHVMAAFYFLTATGGIPATKEQRAALFKLIVPMLKTTEENVSGFLPGLMAASRKLNLKEAYKSGKITPELVTILNDSYEMTPELYQQHSLPERSFILPYLLDEHKLDFSPFKGPDDTGDEWYFNYRINYTPLPIGTGYNHSTLEQITSKAESDYITELANLQQSVKRYLEGVRPTENWLRERMHLEGEALEKAKNDYLVKPKDPETLLKYAEAVEKQYQQRLAENTSRDYAAPCTNIYEAGFYVNPVTCKIYDLRPYQQEIHDLLSVKDWDYLKDFVNTVREAVREFKEPVKKEAGPLSIIAKKTRSLVHAIDKVDENLFAGMFDEKVSNQPALFHTVTIDKGKQKGKKINVTAYIDFDKLPEEIKKELTDYDRRVCEASAAIFNAGNEVTTLTQLYYTMGGAGRPAKKQMEKINQSVTKMMVTLFHLDNKDEIANNINYPKMEYDGPLLPAERVTAIVNGKITDAAIHLFREPPLMTFARERKQIFTCSLELLQSPLNISETKFAIEHCLLSLLAMGKHDTEKEKKKPEQYRKPVKKEMLLETIYKRAKTTDRRTKPRTKEKIKTLLTHYKSKGQIKDFTMTNDRVILEF